MLGINPLTAPDSICRTDEIKIGRNESIRANRIDHHAPRSLNVNLERRNRADIVEIDIGCHAIHVTVVAEHTIPKENGVAAWPIQRNNINPVIALTLSRCLTLPSALISALACTAETESATAKGSFVLPGGQTPETALFNLRCPNYLGKTVWYVQP